MLLCSHMRSDARDACPNLRQSSRVWISFSCPSASTLVFGIMPCSHSAAFPAIPTHAFVRVLCIHAWLCDCVCDCVCVSAGVHLLISPAASHSGWEDHFQSDIFHYLHHRYFEVRPLPACNTPVTPHIWYQ